MDELARTIAVINHGYVGLEQFARIVVNEASSKSGSSDSDIKRLFSTLADLSGARHGSLNVNNIPEEQREAVRTQHENETRADFLSACAPPNRPVNPPTGPTPLPDPILARTPYRSGRGSRGYPPTESYTAQNTPAYRLDGRPSSCGLTKT